VGASNAIDLEEAFASLVRERIEALQLGVHPLFGKHIDQIIALATRNKIRTIYPWREFTAAGGLINYGSSIPNAYRQVGVYTGQILKGADPAEMPVQQPTRFEPVIPGPRAAPGQQVNPRHRAIHGAWIAEENAKPGLILRAEGQQSVSRGRAGLSPRLHGSPVARHDLPLAFLPH
jgi:hypothetical protein